MRRYLEPAVVQRRDDAPTQFLWRDRLYLVRAVLGHWMEAGGWWRSEGAGDAVDQEREIWRVEAGRGATAGTGVYELGFDWTAGSWTVVAALD